MAKKAVEAPKGFHWMKAGKGFKLMKNPAGGYKPHKGASQKATFEIQKIHKKIMATYKGKKVNLNKPRRIGKGETSYGKKEVCGLCYGW